MKRIIAISLLLIFGTSQLNLTWASHFCGVFKVKSELMLGHGHLDCGMVEMNICDSQSQKSGIVVIEKNGCCENVYFTSDTDDCFTASNTLNIQGCDFVIIPLCSFNDLSAENSRNEISIVPFPPPIQKDKSILYRTLII